MTCRLQMGPPLACPASAAPAVPQTAAPAPLPTGTSPLQATGQPGLLLAALLDPLQRANSSPASVSTTGGPPSAQAAALPPPPEGDADPVDLSTQKGRYPGQASRSRSGGLTIEDAAKQPGRGAVGLMPPLPRQASGGTAAVAVSRPSTSSGGAARRCSRRGGSAGRSGVVRRGGSAGSGSQDDDVAGQAAALGVSPQRMKRILANRKSAASAKARKAEYYKVCVYFQQQMHA